MQDITSAMGWGMGLAGLFGIAVLALAVVIISPPGEAKVLARAEKVATKTRRP